MIPILAVVLAPVSGGQRDAGDAVAVAVAANAGGDASHIAIMVGW